MSILQKKIGSVNVVTPISEHPAFHQNGASTVLTPAHVEVADMRYENLDV